MQSRDGFKQGIYEIKIGLWWRCWKDYIVSPYNNFNFVLITIDPTFLSTWRPHEKLKQGNYRNEDVGLIML
jgi:hypothetical protein